LISIKKKDIARKSKSKRKLASPDNLSLKPFPEIAHTATIFDSPPVAGYTLSEPSICKVEMEAALTIIARLENNLSDSTRDALAIQSGLRLDLDKCLANQKLLEEENAMLKEKVTPLTTKEKQIFKEQALSLESLNNDLKLSQEENVKALELVAKLKGELRTADDAFELNSKEWGSRLQSQQNAHNNQILALSSQIDALEMNWKRKVDALESDLAREKYENDSKKMQYQLLEMQCQKSEKDAFHAKTTIKQVLEEMRVVKSQNDKLKRHLSESFEFNAFAQY
jgi:hypothetical protein